MRVHEARLSHASSRSSGEYNGMMRMYSNETSFLNLDQPRTAPPVPPLPQQHVSPQTQRKRRPSSARRPSDASSSQYSVQSPYPAPSKPLPALPPHAISSPTSPSEDVSDGSSLGTRHLSLSSLAASDADEASIDSSIRTPPPPVASRFAQIPEEIYDQGKAPHATLSSLSPAVEVSCIKILESDEKKKSSIFYLDLSDSSSTLASKHGNNILKFWSVADGTVEHTVKFASYTDPQSRSRNYFIRSHGILSESCNIVAIATRLGTTLEIWNWASKKKLQSISDADRWVAGRFVIGDAGWGPFAVYHGESATIDIYAATGKKKPFANIRTIQLKRANLPILPQYPELALSATSPMLVTASGPRPPRRGQPPPKHETLLAAWDIHEDGTLSHVPFKVAKPWEHKELDTALPISVATYGSVVVSIWIPADFIAVSYPQAEGGFKLHPVKVVYQYVLVWDLTVGSTRTIRIPNAVACISPDCRYVAYCDANGVSHGARGRLAILDAMTGQEVWCWPDPDAVTVNAELEHGFRHLQDLSCVTDLNFSANGDMLVVGDRNGRCGLYDVREKI